METANISDEIVCFNNSPRQVDRFNTTTPADIRQLNITSPGSIVEHFNITSRGSIVEHFNITSPGSIVEHFNITTPGNITKPGMPQFAYPLPTVVVSYALIAILALVTLHGNGMVVFVFFRFRFLRKPFNYLTVSLACVDIIGGCVLLPLYVDEALRGYSRFNSLLCHIWVVVDWSIWLTLLYATFLISLNRFLSVRFPIQYIAWDKNTLIIAVVFLNWTVPLMIFTPLIFTRDLADEPTCDVYFTENAAQDAVVELMYFWLPLLGMCFVYFYIYRYIVTKENDSKKMIMKELAEHKPLFKVKLVELETDFESEHAVDNAQPPSKKEQDDKVANDTKKSNGYAEAPEKIKSGMSRISGQILERLSPLLLKKTSTERWPSATAIITNEVTEDVKKLCISSVSEEKPRVSQEAKTSGGDKDADVKKRSTQGRSSGQNLRASAPVRVSQHRQQGARRNTNWSDVDISSDPRIIATSPSKESNVDTIKAEPCSIPVQRTDTKSDSGKRTSGITEISSASIHKIKSLKTLGFILGAFALCWIPDHILLIIQKVDADAVDISVEHICNVLIYLNCVLNPFIYAFMSPQYQDAVRLLLQHDNNGL